eukprot:g4357.t1
MASSSLATEQSLPRNLEVVQVDVDVESPAVLVPSSECPPPAPLAVESPAPFRLMRFLAVLLLVGVCVMAGYLISSRLLSSPVDAAAASVAKSKGPANGAGHSYEMSQLRVGSKINEEWDKLDPKDKEYQQLYLQNEKNMAKKRVEVGNGYENGNGNGGNRNGGQNGGRRRVQQTAKKLNVPVVFHVILTNGMVDLAADNKNGGEGALQAQIAVLNIDFADGFTGTTDYWASVRIINPAPRWNFYMDSYKEVKQAATSSPYQQSTREVGKLNVYVVNMADNLGYAYFLGATNYVNEQRWHNHTRRHGRESCSVDDGIADTPNQDKPNWGCGSSGIFCSGVSREMYENFMDYSDNACYTRSPRCKMR